VAELVVVGGGPAGVSAALTAAGRGLAVTLIDNSPLLGGQIWRGTSPEPVRAVSRHRRVDVEASTSVIRADARDGGGARLIVRGPAGVRVIEAPAMVLATGASELSLPFPGWDLPGVVTPGAAQALLKAHGVRVGARAVVAGTGPFLWPVAAALARAGVRVAALVEAAPARTGAALAAGLAGHLALAVQATRYLGAVARARIPVLTGRAVVAVHGHDRVESVVVERPDGSRRRELEVDAACVGWGFVPAVDIARGLGCREVAHAVRPIRTVAVDAAQRTSVPGVLAAGEITGIGGAIMAAAEGTIAGAVAAGAAPPRRAVAVRRRAARSAAAFDRAYPIPTDWLERLEPGTVVCRCEDVTWQQVTDVIADGIADVRAIKGQVRCGMGWCQGRVCGPALQLAVAARAGRPVDVVGDLATRPFATAPTIGELAQLGGQV
jgi:NADPH-dependent 2,4-dienoyl-CoA reductase/sulfur reductase-like enzyme